MTVWGYARVSTTAQDVEMQRDALRKAGVADEHLVTDHVSGTKASRPGLNRLLGKLTAGDVLTVWKLDRLGRSTHHLVALMEDFRQREVELRSLTEGIDTTTPTGRLMFGIMSSLASFERDLIRERTSAGLAAARERGAMLGRPSRVTPEQVRMIRRMSTDGTAQRTIAATVGLPRTTVGRIIRGEVPSLDRFAGEGDEGSLL